ncbi:CDP-diacylglycerol--glycerol-3-phosphate 3-phosphatidyltransferase [Podila humilis]|nr:CDP-diacylglycerol--glycerol-3-phosphate 3-phosphatidyltransferase [Podila humilis]
MLLARTIARPASIATLVRCLSTQNPHKHLQSDDTYIARTLQLFQDTRPAVPRFVVQGDKVKPILSPSEFYSDMKIATLSDALRSKPNLKLNLLLDGLRGTRDTGKGSSVSLLYPLLQAYPNQVSISLYHTPDLSGLLKQVMPPRFNEGIGLMHLKVYTFDDTLIMSGANMSHDYFTNRQDRYITFHNADITKYFNDLVSVISSVSYSLKDNNNTFKLAMEPGVPDPVKESKAFKDHAFAAVSSFLKTNSRIQQTPLDPSYDTTLYPLAQMGPFGIRQEERVTLSVLDHILHDKSLSEHAKMFITSGYFNFEKRYSRAILNSQSADVCLIAASPEANGFFNSAGISKYIPPAYTLIEKRFFDKAKLADKGDVITIEEYKREGWTYHAKGLWVYPPASDLPAITTIGSPNFGYRSIVRDLEAQLFLVTSNIGLRASLHTELHSLRKYSERVTDETFNKPDRRVPVWVGGASRAIRSML